MGRVCSETLSCLTRVFWNLQSIGSPVRGCRKAIRAVSSPIDVASIAPLPLSVGLIVPVQWAPRAVGGPSPSCIPCLSQENEGDSQMDVHQANLTESAAPRPPPCKVWEQPWIGSLCRPCMPWPPSTPAWRREEPPLFFSKHAKATVGTIGT